MVVKSWIVSSLLINDQIATVINEETNIKLKIDIDTETKILRLFYPGTIQFSDRDYEQSKGSRLATDMGMSKIPDKVLYENYVPNISMTENEDDNDNNNNNKKQQEVILSSSDEEYGEVKLNIELASKWSLKELCKLIKNAQS